MTYALVSLYQVLCRQIGQRIVEGEFFGQDKLGMMSGGLRWASHCDPAQAWAHPLDNTSFL